MSTSTETTVTVSMDPTSTSKQSDVIGPATPRKAGAMSARQAALLEQVVQQGSRVRTTLTDVKIADYTASIGESVPVDPTHGGSPFSVVITLPSLGHPGEQVIVSNITSAAGLRNIVVQGALSHALVTTGSINSGSFDLSIADVSPFIIGQPITVAGAGVAGADLVTTIAGSGLGTLTLNDAASTSVVNASVTSVGRDNIDAGPTFLMNTAYRSVTLEDCRTFWKKIALV